MYVKVRAFPDAKKERVTKIADHRFEIMVRAPAERNLANQRIRALLAAEYKVPISQVRIVTGHRSHGKVFEIENLI